MGLLALSLLGDPKKGGGWELNFFLCHSGLSQNGNRTKMYYNCFGNVGMKRVFNYVQTLAEGNERIDPPAHPLLGFANFVTSINNLIVTTKFGLSQKAIPPTLPNKSTVIL